MLEWIGNRSVMAHAAEVISAATIQHDPFPHLSVNGVLPAWYFGRLLENLPYNFGQAAPFQHVKLQRDDALFRAMPSNSRKFWTQFEASVKPAVCGALAIRLASYAAEKMADLFGSVVAVSPSELKPQRGIIQCRARGAVQEPHIDKATTAFTFLFYFSGTPGPYGTTLYNVANKAEMLDDYRKRADVRVWSPDPVRYGISAAKTLRFAENSLVAFAGVAHAVHGVTDVPNKRISMQNYCELPARLKRQFFQWNDALTGQKYDGGL
jgi:hypothetical protein